jgi:hypothetical protein
LIIIRRKLDQRRRLDKPKLGNLRRRTDLDRAAFGRNLERKENGRAGKPV